SQLCCVRVMKSSSMKHVSGNHSLIIGFILAISTSTTSNVQIARQLYFNARFNQTARSGSRPLFHAQCALSPSDQLYRRASGRGEKQSRTHSNGLFQLGTSQASEHEFSPGYRRVVG